MAEKRMNAVLRLRRDAYFNYENKISFIPLDGEVCLVNTAHEGLRAKIGDGQTQYKNLNYVDFGIIQKGYYHDGGFYADRDFQNKLDTSAIIYIDIVTRVAYYFDNNEFIQINKVPSASSEVPGILKLYDTWDGLNEDGAVTQKALKLKFEELSDRITNLEKQKIIMDALNNEEIIFQDFNVEVIS